MVFVSVGTQKQSFKRLFHLVEDSKILESKRIIAQAGYTSYRSDRIEIFQFMDHENYQKYMKEADLVICHGGVGTIFDALYSGKKILAVPRLSKYEEHVNDHQIEICEELDKEGYLMYLKEFDLFDEKVKQLMKTELKKYVPNYDYIEILKKEI